MWTSLRFLHSIDGPYRISIHCNMISIAHHKNMIIAKRCSGLREWLHLWAVTCSIGPLPEPYGIHYRSIGGYTKPDLVIKVLYRDPIAMYRNPIWPYRIPIYCNRISIEHLNDQIRFCIAPNLSLIHI